MKEPFFKKVDWNKLEMKDGLKAPYKPKINSIWLVNSKKNKKELIEELDSPKLSI